jgi:hypothetical protein
VAAGLAINPNTVLKAYRLLEHEGLAAGFAVPRSHVAHSPPGRDDYARRAQALVPAPAAFRRRGVFVADYEIDAA